MKFLVQIRLALFESSRFRWVRRIPITKHSRIPGIGLLVYDLRRLEERRRRIHTNRQLDARQSKS